MKNLYINSRLHPLLLAPADSPVQWIHSMGEPWLLLTPDRLCRLADRLGLADRRVRRLVGLVRRHSGTPELFCRRLGIGENRYLRPDEYPPALCPRCDGLHHPHPEDAGLVCPDCRERERRAERSRPGGGALRDRRLDLEARRNLRVRQPGDFDGEALSPNYKLNRNRRLERDWDRAVNRILMGGAYRTVAKEFDCSVGLLHRKVKERFWENN